MLISFTQIQRDGDGLPIQKSFLRPVNLTVLYKRNGTIEIDIPATQYAPYEVAFYGLSNVTFEVMKSQYRLQNVGTQLCILSSSHTDTYEQKVGSCLNRKKARVFSFEKIQSGSEFVRIKNPLTGLYLAKSGLPSHVVSTRWIRNNKRHWKILESANHIQIQNRHDNSYLTSLDGRYNREGAPLRMIPRITSHGNSDYQKWIKLSGQISPSNRGVDLSSEVIDLGLTEVFGDGFNVN